MDGCIKVKYNQPRWFSFQTGLREKCVYTHLLIYSSTKAFNEVDKRRAREASRFTGPSPKKQAQNGLASANYHIV